MTQKEKIEYIIEEIACGGFVEEDYFGADCCKYCHKRYGNIMKVSETHNDGCIYQIAKEVYKELML